MAAAAAVVPAAAGPQLWLPTGGPTCARLLACAALVVIAAATGLPYLLVGDGLQASRAASLVAAARDAAGPPSPSSEPTLLDEERISTVHSAKVGGASCRCQRLMIAWQKGLRAAGVSARIVCSVCNAKL
eukprot:SM000021S06498  [mRNA]  locus=s21:718335:718818:+ [translate_table: standard]